MRHHWSTYTVVRPPSESLPIETLNDDLTTMTTFTTVRAYLKHLRQKRPSFQFKSVRHGSTDMGSAVVEIKMRYNPALIRREANQ